MGGVSPSLYRATGVCLPQQHRERPLNHGPSLLTTQRQNLTLDCSWRCKYKPLAHLLPVLLHHHYYFLFLGIKKLRSCLHSCGNLMDVWCLRLESIPSQITDSLYVQLSHAIAVWMTFDPWPVLSRPSCVWCTYAMPSVCYASQPWDKLSCVTKVKKETESLEERVSCGCFHELAMVSIPSCLYLIQWTFGKLPVLHSEWYECVRLFVKLSVVVFMLWCIWSADEKSSAGFLILFRWFH